MNDSASEAEQQFFKKDQTENTTTTTTTTIISSNSSEENNELERLQKLLKIEKDERKKAIDAIQEDMEKELRELEQKWMEKVRKATEERDDVAKKMDDFEEKIDNMKRQVHRSETYKMEIEEANQRLRLQYETLQRDYEETMHERGIVLEENSRLMEEKERLQKEIGQLKQLETDELGSLKKKLEHTRRLLQVNMEETVNANAKRDAAVARLTEAEQKSARYAEERDEALRRCRQTSNDSIVDIWNTHSVQINLPYPKPNLGILLGGGRTDESAVHGPIYVKQIAHGSPFESLLRKLDHIVMVNDISVIDMDERSVMGMLSNCHFINLVIRRRSSCNRIVDVCLPLNYGVGLELANGVFVNSCEPNGAASRSGIAPGQRVVHIMHTPVYDAKHAEMLIKNAREPLIIGILESSRKSDSNSKDKHRPTIFSRWFGRNGAASSSSSSAEKERNIVAKANIDRNPNDSSLLRQGSLRMPQTSSAAVSPLVRYGSLRAPTYSASTDHGSPLDKRFGGVKSSANSEISSTTHKPWSPSSVNEKDLVFAGMNVEGVPVYIPKNTQMFSTPTSPVSRLLREDHPQKRTVSQLSSPRDREYRAWDNNDSNRRSFSSNTTTSDARPYSMHFTPTSSTIMENKPHRASVHSPAHMPQFPSIRDDSLSSVMSSSNSIRLPSTSFSYHHTNNSACSLTSGNMPPHNNRHCVSKDGSDFSISTSGSAMHGLDRPRRSDRLLGAMKTTNQPRLVQVPRGDVRLCGGNAIGILAEKSVGSDLMEGDLILEVDGNCVRNTTLECAVNTLWADDDELTRLLVQDGGDRLNRLRLGADGDSFFLRVNIDRNVENKDELELKSGDVVFVDKTLFMGKKGRWRAWKVDKEGRQREHGAIPSSTSIYQSIRTNRYANPFPRKAYEWVEKLDTKVKRPVLLFGALVEPFLQMLVDESDRFSQVARESLTASFEEVSSLIKEKVIIDSKQNDDVYDLYHVISTAHVMDITAQGLHCVIHVDPAAIERLKRCRVYPIIVKIRFKSVKQLKDINEHICGEKISSKEAKQLIEKDMKIEKELEGAVTLVVPNHNNVSFMLTHAVLQLKKLVEDEQKKTVWVQRKVDDNM